MNILILVILSVVLYALFAIFLSRMGGKIDANIGASIFMGLGMVVPLAYYFYDKFIKNSEILPTSSAGLLYAVLAGISIAIWNILILIIFAKGGNLSYVFPVIYGAGAIAIPSLFGWLFLKETITVFQGTALTLILIGVLFIIFSKLQAV